MTAGLKFVKNLLNPDKVAPTLWRGKFGAPGTAIAVGDLLEMTGNTNTEFVPLDSDYDMSANKDLAVAACSVISGDRAGYYPIWLIMPWDVWEVEIAATTSADGTSVYYSAKNTVTTSAGTNIIGNIADDRRYPVQGHLSVDGSPDAGTTLRSVTRIGITFQPSNSFAARLETA